VLVERYDNESEGFNEFQATYSVNPCDSLSYLGVNKQFILYSIHQALPTVVVMGLVVMHKKISLRSREIANGSVEPSCPPRRSKVKLKITNPGKSLRTDVLQ
jgi:hypothetical protein